MRRNLMSLQKAHPDGPTWRRKVPTEALPEGKGEDFGS
jgi:hypothetical protein